MNLYYYKISFQKLVLKQVINLIFVLGEILFFCYLGVKNNLLSFALIFLLFLITWNFFLFLKSYIYNTKEIIITIDFILKYNGLKYFQKYEVDLELKNCKYFLIKTTIKSANYTLQINHNNGFIFFDIGEEESFKIYNILKEKFPENDLGQKWKYIIIGNTW